MPVVLPPATILVTGVSGFVGSHVARAYLTEGFTVRGTVRSSEKGERLRSLFATEFPGRFEYAIADIENAADVDTAARGVDGIAHVASPITKVPPGGDPQTVIRPAVVGTLNVLRSAAKAKTVRRVVITGSFGAVFEPHEAPYTYSAKDWNDHAVRAVADIGDLALPWQKYCTAKVLAERAAYGWVADNKPSFDLGCVLPSWIFGPVLSPVYSIDDVPDTPKLLVNIFQAPEEATEYMEGVSLAFVHVQDVARAHIAVHIREDLGHNTRLILSSKTTATFQQFYDAYWSLPNAPRLPFDVPRGEPAPTTDAGMDTSYSFETSEEVLGWKFASLTDIVRDTLGDLAPRIYNV